MYKIKKPLVTNGLTHSLFFTLSEASLPLPLFNVTRELVYQIPVLWAVESIQNDRGETRKLREKKPPKPLPSDMGPLRLGPPAFRFFSFSPVNSSALYLYNPEWVCCPGTSGACVLFSTYRHRSSRKLAYP